MSARRKPAAIGSMPPPPRPSTPHSTHQPQPSQHPPPPSSVAEIVHNYSKTDNDANEYSTRAHLAELFDAIIGSEAGEFREDIATSHKVLETVMNAGLMFTFSKDPLLQIEYILEQVSASLKVIKYFIEKAPASLFCSPPAENSQPNQPHLCLWLLPRLFTLLGNPKTRPLTAMLLEAIEAIFMTVANRPKYWKHLRSMTGYCRESLNCEYNHPFLRFLQELR